MRINIQKSFLFPNSLYLTNNQEESHNKIVGLSLKFGTSENYQKWPNEWVLQKALTTNTKLKLVVLYSREILKTLWPKASKTLLKKAMFKNFFWRHLKYKDGINNKRDFFAGFYAESSIQCPISNEQGVARPLVRKGSCVISI